MNFTPTSFHLLDHDSVNPHISSNVTFPTPSFDPRQAAFHDTFSSSMTTTGGGKNNVPTYTGIIAGILVAVSDTPFETSSIIGNIAPGVPEPATWAMMIAGLGLVGSTLRASMRKVVFAA